MELWHIYVGGGRFIVRAEDEEQAIAFARKEAEGYCPEPEEAQKAGAKAELLDIDGPAAILNVDFS